VVGDKSAFARVERAEIEIGDQWSLTLPDVRAVFSEVIGIYVAAMRDPTNGYEHRLAAARLAQQALNDYLRLLNVTEVQKEVEQTQRIVGKMRSDLPNPFEDDDRGQV
jgi:hypothetical protein